MKNFKKQVGSLVAGAIVLSALPVISSQVQDIKGSLSKVRAPELPAAAASVVASAKAKDLMDVTVATVRAAYSLSPVGTPAVVGSIARKTPSAAATAAATAVSLQPLLVREVVAASVKAAPQYAGEIVAAVCKEVPKQYSLIATEASIYAPTADKAILDGVAASVPALRPYIEIEKDKAVAKGEKTSVSYVMFQTETRVRNTSRALKVKEDVLMTQVKSRNELTNLETVQTLAKADTKVMTLDFAPAPPPFKPNLGNAYGHSKINKHRGGNYSQP